MAARGWLMAGGLSLGDAGLTRNRVIGHDAKGPMSLLPTPRTGNTKHGMVSPGVGGSMACRGRA